MILAIGCIFSPILRGIYGHIKSRRKTGKG
jgi:hypothetical protein